MKKIIFVFCVTSGLFSFGKDNEWKKWMISYLSCSNCSFDMQFKMYEKSKPGNLDVEKGRFVRVDSTKEFYSIGDFSAVRNSPQYLEVDNESRVIYYQEKQRNTGSVQQLFVKFSDTIYSNIYVILEKKLSGGDLSFLLGDKDSSFKSAELIFDKDHILKSIKIEMNDVVDHLVDEYDQPYVMVQSPVWEIHYSDFKSGISPDLTLFNIGTYIKRTGARTLGTNKFADYTVHNLD